MTPEERRVMIANGSKEREFWIEWATRAHREIAALLADTIGHDAHAHAPSIGEAVDLAIAAESQLAALLGIEHDAGRRVVARKRTP